MILCILTTRKQKEIHVDDQNDHDDSVETTIYGTRWASRDIPR